VDRQLPDLTQLLRAWSGGNRAALDRLVPAVYTELGRIATRHLRGRRRNDTVQPTVLVHEAYVRLRGTTPVAWQDRAHFFAVAAQLMRRILVDHIRSRAAAKRGGGSISLSFVEPAVPGLPDPDVLDVHTALEELSQLDAQQAHIVELRFFGGLSIEETAEALGISPATVKRDWTIAKTWIRRRLGPAKAG
jgi:RNA polymerase sigma factor (TIGR02999 family)